ncbi:hypothetical protein FRB90_001396 [Tulasnella sp. 427]|nr:hypothetical protein FRB90_001396 [Tulasnella sp. 427]
MDTTKDGPGVADPTKDPTPAEAAKTAPATKNGRKRGSSTSFTQAPQLKPAPVGGMSFGFTAIKKRRTQAETGKQEDVEMAIEEEEETLEEDFERLRDMDAEDWIGDEYGLRAQEEADEATTSTIQNVEDAHPRYLPPSAIVKDIDAAGYRWIHEQKLLGRKVCWAQVYLTPRPTARTAELVAEGIAELERTERVEGFDKTEYEVQRFTKKNNGGTHFSLAISCATEEAERKLIYHGDFRHAIGSESVMVWIQKGRNLGTHIILDISNAPQAEGSFLEGCYKAFKDVILWSNAAKNKDQWVPVDFQYAKITRALSNAELAQWHAKGKRKPNERPPKETPTKDWRIAFTPNLRKIEELKWTVPRTAGLSAKGDIIVRTPPFCEDCISHSHARRHCQWWDEASAVERTSRPRDFLITNWKPAASFLEEAQREKDGIMKAAREASRKAKATTVTATEETGAGSDGENDRR